MTFLKTSCKFSDFNIFSELPTFFGVISRILFFSYIKGKELKALPSCVSDIIDNSQNIRIYLNVKFAVYKQKVYFIFYSYYFPKEARAF